METELVPQSLIKVGNHSLHKEMVCSNVMVLAQRFAQGYLNHRDVDSVALPKCLLLLHSWTLVRFPLTVM
jgi:hypothetical protein